MCRSVAGGDSIRRRPPAPAGMAISSSAAIAGAVRRSVVVGDKSGVPSRAGSDAANTVISPSP